MFDYENTTFVILESIFDSNLKMDQLFDLKGSKKGRIAKGYARVLKDLNFTSQMNLGPMREKFIDQIRDDTMVRKAAATAWAALTMPSSLRATI